MWTLIIFIIIHGRPAVTSVPGFTTLIQCNKQAQIIKANEEPEGLTGNMICIEVK